MVSRLWNWIWAHTNQALTRMEGIYSHYGWQYILKHSWDSNLSLLVMFFIWRVSIFALGFALKRCVLSTSNFFFCTNQLENSNYHFINVWLLISFDVIVYWSSLKSFPRCNVPLSYSQSKMSHNFVTMTPISSSTIIVFFPHIY